MTNTVQAEALTHDDQRVLIEAAKVLQGCGNESLIAVANGLIVAIAEINRLTEREVSLVAEVEDVKAERDVALGQLTILRTQVIALQADAVDAERYRWLREQDDQSDVFCMYGKVGSWGECGHCEIYGELLDTSVDAARTTKETP